MVNEATAYEAPSRSDYPFWIKRYPERELASKLRDVKPDVRGLVNDLRDYGLYHGGLPTDLESLEEIARSRFWSRYKFRKLWKNFCAKFFIEYAGAFWYEPDLEQVIKVHDISRKRSFSGALGAERKKENASKPADPEPIRPEPFAPSDSGNCQNSAEAFADLRASDSSSYSSSSVSSNSSSENIGPQIVPARASPEQSVNVQEINQLRALWKDGGVPWNTYDENAALESVANLPPDRVKNLCGYATWAFANKWPTPAKTKRFADFYFSGIWNEGAPLRKLPAIENGGPKRMSVKDKLKQAGYL